VKLDSEGKVTLEIDEARITRVSDGDAWKFEMLKQNTKTATYMEVAYDDHRELRQMVIENKILLVRIASAIGILLTLLIGTAVVV